jgi:protein gp37
MSDGIWNPWHGCHKYSEGCANCYVYRRDESIGKDASQVTKTASFDAPVKRDRQGSYKIPAGSEVFCCMTSDFFIEEADEWRPDIWRMMKTRSDVEFFIITKRIVRFMDCAPPDWGEGYPNVSVCCTMENQKQCDIRFPVFNSLPIRRKFVCCEPLLSNINMRQYLNPDILQVLAGGESGSGARVCDYEWVLNIRSQCLDAGVRFYFKQTGYRFLKDGKLYTVARKFQHSQAKKAGIDT